MADSPTTEFEQELAFQSELVEELRPKAYRDPSRMPQLILEVQTLAELWLKKGAFHQAEALYRRILYRLLDAPAMDAELILGVSSLLAELQVRWGEPEGARDLYEKACELGTRLGVEASRTLSLMKNNLGCVFKALGDYEPARKAYEDALESLAAMGDGGALVAADVSDNMGALCYRMLQMEEALEWHQRALAIRSSRAQGGGDFGLRRCCAHLAAAHRALGQFEEAQAMQRRADEAADADGTTPAHPGVAAFMLEEFLPVRDIVQSACATPS